MSQKVTDGGRDWDCRELTDEEFNQIDEEVVDRIDEVVEEIDPEELTSIIDELRDDPDVHQLADDLTDKYNGELMFENVRVFEITLDPENLPTFQALEIPMLDASEDIAGITVITRQREQIVSIQASALVHTDQNRIKTYTASAQEAGPDVRILEAKMDQILANQQRSQQQFDVMSQQIGEMGNQVDDLHLINRESIDLFKQLRSYNFYQTRKCRFCLGSNYVAEKLVEKVLPLTIIGITGLALGLVPISIPISVAVALGPAILLMHSIEIDPAGVGTDLIAKIIEDNTNELRQQIGRRERCQKWGLCRSASDVLSS